MNIVIIDQNTIYRESLRTALDQIPDINVVFDMDITSSLENINNIPVHLILIDYSLGKEKCDETMRKAVSLWHDVRFLILTTYKEECGLNGIYPIDYILKNSTKKEFETIIRKQQSGN
jgi:DNA-binding NarL/FixJ family response regulator